MSKNEPGPEIVCSSASQSIVCRLAPAHNEEKHSETSVAIQHYHEAKCMLDRLLLNRYSSVHMLSSSCSELFVAQAAFFLQLLLVLSKLP
jgi:hypothetical protein